MLWGEKIFFFKLNNFFRTLGFLLILSSLVMAITIDSSSATTESFHIGVIGGNSSGENSEGDFTVLFSQPVSDTLGSFSEGDLRWGESGTSEIHLEGGQIIPIEKTAVSTVLEHIIISKNLFPLIFFILGLFLVLYYILK